MIEWFSFIAIISFRIFSVFLGIWQANGDFDILETIYFMGLKIVKIWFELCFPQNSGSFQLSQDGHMLIHGLLYKWTELLYLTCPHEADLLTLIMLHKLTQYLSNFILSSLEVGH